MEKEKRAQKAEAMPRKHRKLPWSYLLLAIFPGVSFFVFPAFSLYYQNTGEFTFGITAVAKAALIGCGASFLLLSTLAFLLPQKRALPVFSSLTFSLGLGLYVQYNFLNPAVGTLNGSPIDWSAYASRGALSLAFWIACLVLPLVLTLCWRPGGLRVLKGLSLFVTAVEAATVIALVVTSPPVHLSDFSVTTEHALDVSDDNIVVFVMDTVDESVFQELRTTAPECAEDCLEDFVGFTNCVGGGSPTIFGLPLLLTGQPYEPTAYPRLPGYYDAYLTQAYGKCPLYQDLAQNGYHIGLYTDSMFLQGCPEELMQNFGYGTWYINNDKKFAATLYKFCAFLTAPQQLKPVFWCYTEEFAGFVTVKGYQGETCSCSSQNDHRFYQHLTQDGLAYCPGEKNYRFYHTMGAHDPYDLDEELQYAAGSTMEKKARGSFRLLQIYIQQLKDLGVYDNTAIVVTADHGSRHEQAYANPMVMIKQKHHHGAYEENSAPITFEQFPATVASQFLEDYDAYGESYFDVTADEYPDRTLTVHTPLLLQGHAINSGYDPASNVVQFMFHGNVNDNRFEITGSYQ